VTTRFPRDAARRFAAQPDFAQFADRLHVYGLDLRHLPAVEAFAAEVCRTYPRLDVLVNNAAQTVRRPPAFYRHPLDLELAPRDALPAALRPLLPADGRAMLSTASADALPVLAGALATSRRAVNSAALSQLALLPGDDQPDDALFPPGRFDADGDQIDLRPQNSWGMRDADVSAVELMEVHMVNAVAPFLLTRGLRPLLDATPAPARFVVNVSSVEGWFGRASRSGRHPHTNMAKAALNMLTFTVARDYAKSGVYVNAVDPGWINLQHAAPQARTMTDAGFVAPFDVTDAAARILDPVYTAVNGGPCISGKFFKDYQAIDW